MVVLYMYHGKFLPGVNFQQFCPSFGVAKIKPVKILLVGNLAC